jgi:hypothetical protein
MKKSNNDIHNMKMELYDLTKTSSHSNEVLIDFQKKVVSLATLQKRDILLINTKLGKVIANSDKKTITSSKTLKSASESNKRNVRPSIIKPKKVIVKSGIKKSKITARKMPY